MRYNTGRPIRTLRSMGETKIYDRSINHSALGATTQPLAEISLGNDYNQRVGRKIDARYLHVNLLESGSTTSPTRVILYVPKNASDNLTLTNKHGAVNTSSFWVIKDLWFSGGTDSNLPSAIQFNHRFPMGMKIEWDDSTQSGITTNNLKMYIDCGASSTVTGHTKLFYKDR